MQLGYGIAIAVVVLVASCAGPEPQHAADGGGGDGAGNTGGEGGSGGAVVPKEIGASCSSNEGCISGFCPEADGVCCDVPCATLCEACRQQKTGMPDGTCAPVTAHADPDLECADVNPECDVAGNPCHACDGAKGCRLINGALCAFNPECISGFCNQSAFPYQCAPP